MKNCKQCGSTIPNSIKINGKRFKLNSRSYCIECHPIGEIGQLKFKPNERWQKLPQIINECHSISDVLRSVGLLDHGSNHLTAKKVIKFYDLDISHFKRRSPTRRSFESIFCENSDVAQAIVRDRFLQFTEHKCTKCGITEWNGLTIQLQVDHENGNKRDNRLINLRLLCPNCHSQTETWGRKTIEHPVQKPVAIIESINNCKHCNKETNNISFCSADCCQKHKRKTKRPSKDELELEVTNNSFRKVAQKYGVSDKAIRKWVNYYGIEIRKSYCGKTIP